MKALAQKLDGARSAWHAATCPAADDQGLQVHITGRRARVEAGTGDLFENGRKFIFIYKPEPRQPWVRLPWISPTQQFAGYPAIGLEVGPSGQCAKAAQFTGNDKANLGVAKFGFQEQIFWGFAVLLSADHFDVPQAGTLLAQIWQGSPYGPPLGLQLVPGDDQFACEVTLRNNATGGNPSAPVIRLPLGHCPPGQWQTFRLGILARHAGQPGPGEVVIWHNDMVTPAIRWQGDFGYDPARLVGVNGNPAKPQGERLPNSAFDTFIGPYRGAQNTRAQTFWSNIKFGSTAAACDPTRP